ncbi:MAG: hypothetical protein U1E51_25200 [Candidatus Binatia bacterium]|nr:hypothetical protein [Candidatus Binatia bacterium]
MTDATQIIHLLREAKLTRLDIALKAGVSRTVVYRIARDAGLTKKRVQHERKVEQDSEQPRNWRNRADELEAKYGHVEGTYRLMREWTADGSTSVSVADLDRQYVRMGGKVRTGKMRRQNV